MAGTNFQVMAAPTQEQLTLSAIKPFLRVDFDDEDDLISQFIQDARIYAEDITKRALAPQTIRATIEPDRAVEGALSGPIVGEDIEPFRYAERITAVPFGFYGPCFALPRTPVGSVSLVEYQLTPFDVSSVPGNGTEEYTWTTLAAFDSNNNATYRLDTNTDPAQLFIMPMLIAERFRFTYAAGYAIGACPPPIVSAMRALISFWYNNREGQPVPVSIDNALARKRVWEL